MDTKRSGELWSSAADSPSLEADVLAVVYADVRRAVDDQHQRLRHLRYLAGLTMAVSVGSVGLLLPEAPLPLLAEASLLFVLLTVGFAAMVMLPADLGERQLTLVSLRRFDTSTSAAALSRRLVSVGRLRLKGNEPLLKSRSFFLRLTLIGIVAQVTLLMLALADVTFFG